MVPSSRLWAIASLLLALALAPAAPAAVLPVSGTLQITLGSLGGPTFTGSGIGSSTGAVNAPFTIPAGLLSATSDVTVAVTPAALGISLIQVQASPTMPVLNAAGAFGPLSATPFGGNFGGAMGNNGFARLWISGSPFYSSYPYPNPTTCGPGGGVLPTHPNCLAGVVPLKYVGGGGAGMAGIAGLPAGAPPTAFGEVLIREGATSCEPSLRLPSRWVSRCSPAARPGRPSCRSAGRSRSSSAPWEGRPSPARGSAPRPAA